jgi:hypothetical protein
MNAKPSTTCPDPDLDGPALELMNRILATQGIRLHHLLCKLAHGPKWKELGSRRLCAVADELVCLGYEDSIVQDMLRFLAELSAIAAQGEQAAAAATDRRCGSETARHFGKPVAVLCQAVEACLRQHRW